MIFKYLLLILPFSFIGTAQQYTEKQIDSIQENGTHSLKKDGKFEETMMLNMELIEFSKQLNYGKGVARGYMHIANVLNTLGRHEESLRYLDLAEREGYTTKDPEVKARISGEYGRNYIALGAHEKAIENFDKGILYFKGTKGENKRLLAFLYHNKAVSFSALNNLDSALTLQHKAIRANPSLFGYSVLAYHHLIYQNNKDSAEFYLNKAGEILHEQRHSMYDRSVYLLNRGRLCKSNGEYETALDYYKQALAISWQIKRPKEVRRSYKLQSGIYELLGDRDKSHEYLVKYTRISDSLNRERRKGINVLVKKFLKEQEEEYHLVKKRFQYITWGTIGICTITFLLIWKHFKRKRMLIMEKDILIKQKETESKELKRKLNLAFGEIVGLAKANDPSFLARFQEVYPEVCKKLLAINPKLANTELILCAMIWLNFSSKEIARYIFVQPKTVQVKKYRLRKRLNIPMDKNIYLWIRNL